MNRILTDEDRSAGHARRTTRFATALLGVFAVGGVAHFARASSTSSFVPATPLAQGRTQPATVLLSTGKILVLGGQTGPGAVTASVEVFDPATGTVTPGPEMSTARRLHQAILEASGKVFVTGGYGSNGNPLRSTEIYDPASNSWSNGPNMLVARAWHTATLLPSGNILIAGGETAPNVPTITTEVYVTGLNQFFPNPSMSIPRFGHTASTALGPTGPRVVLAGGILPNGACSATTDIYDFLQNKMTVGPQMSTGRCEAVANGNIPLPDGSALIAGGDSQAGVPSRTAEIFRAATLQFTAPVPMTSGHTAGTATMLSTGAVLVAGGFDGGEHATSSAEVFDSHTGAFARVGDMIDARAYAAATLDKDGDVVVEGGENDSGVLRSIEIFQPGTPCSPPISISPTALPAGKVGNAYDQKITISGSAPFDISPFSADLPAGVTGTLSSSGEIEIQGTPLAGGTYPFSFQVKDSNDCTAIAEFVLTVASNCPPIDIVPGAGRPEPYPLFPETVGHPFVAVFLPTAGLGTSFTWEVTGGALPPGMTIDPNGEFATIGEMKGTPTTAGDYTFTLTVTDSFGCKGSHQYSVHIAPCPPLVVHVFRDAAPDGQEGTFYAWGVFASGGTPPYTYSGSGLPTGLRVDPDTGTFSGNLAAGNYTFVIRATDKNGCGGSVIVHLKIGPPGPNPPCPPITIGPLPSVNPLLGQHYSYAFEATGGTGPYAFTIASFAPGLTGAGGTLAGTPTQAGTYPIVVTVVDAKGCPGIIGFLLTVGNCPDLKITPTTLPGGAFGGLYSSGVSASGGSGLYSFVGAPPAGLTVFPDGSIGGVPTASGHFSFPVTVIDTQTNCTGSTLISIDLLPCGGLALGPDRLTNPLKSSAYAQPLAAHGGTPPYAYAVESGALPAGVMLDGHAGALTGTPTADGTFGFVVTLSDARGCKVSQAYTITVDTAATPDLVVDKTADVATAAEGDPISYTITVTNVGSGSTSAQWSVDDLLPARFLFDAATPSNGSGLSCSESTVNGRGNVSCQSPTPLASGASATVRIDVTVGPDAAEEPAMNVATASGGGESRIDDNSGFAVVDIGHSQGGQKVTTPKPPHSTKVKPRP